MTRKSKREIVRDLAGLEAVPGAENALLVARRDPKTGELTEASTGEPVDPDDHGAEQLVVIRALRRHGTGGSRARGCEILGPAEDVPNSRDVVRVVWDDAARKHAGKKYGR